jgi:diguanylate cyclase (GGDEF)-like protein
MSDDGRQRDMAARATVLLVALGVGLAAFSQEFAAADLAWRAAVLGGAAMAAWRAVRRNGMPAWLGAAILVAAVRMVLVDTGDLTFTIRDATWRQALSDLVSGPVLVASLAYLLRMRRRGFGAREVVDVVSVAAAAALIGWTAVANPAWQAGLSLPLAIAGGSYLLIAFLLLHFAVELTFEGLVRNRAMQLLLLGTMLNLVATVFRTGVATGDSIVPIPLNVGMFAAAFLIGCAALAHPDAPGVIRPGARATADERHEAARLLPFALALAWVGFLAATVPATSRADEIVQALLVVSIVLAVVGRLHGALATSIRAQVRLERRLHTDELTALSNRAGLVRDVGIALDAHWGSPRRPTLVQVNVDRFKQLNDAVGHDAANQLLIELSRRIVDAVQPLDGMVARTGGDEFVVLDTAAGCEADALARVAAISAALATPFHIDGAPVFVTASIGVAIAPNHRTIDADGLVRRANIATHRAKQDGRNRAVFFDDAMQSKITRQVAVEHALHAALERDEMLLYHQPIVDLVSGQLTGFEALLRWRRSDGDLVSPADFIPIAEETGIIVDLGRWALVTALGDLRRWIDAGVVPPTTTMSVNVSPRQIADPDFPSVVESALANTDVPAHQLWLEVTESMMLEEPDLAETSLRRIRATGVRLALDDFGTGYSSLSLLQRFPIQRLKIDRAFVQGIAERNNDRSLVRTIVALARSMGHDLVAEGVETMAQVDALRELGCDRAQGYLFSRPVPVEAVPRTVEALASLSDVSGFATVAAPRANGSPAAAIS